MEPSVDQEFACEDCGFTSPVPNDVCPSCGGRVAALNAPTKPKADAADENGEPALDDASLEAGIDETNEAGELSLEQLQERESAEDTADLDYGDGDE